MSLFTTLKGKSYPFVTASGTFPETRRFKMREIWANTYEAFYPGERILRSLEEASGDYFNVSELRMQTDGNFVFYDGDFKAQYASGTNGNRGYYFRMAKKSGNYGQWYPSLFDKSKVLKATCKRGFYSNK